MIWASGRGHGEPGNGVKISLRLEEEEEECEEEETDKWDENGPTEDAVVFGFFGLEIGEEANDGGVGAELGEAREKHGSIDHHTGQSDFFLREAVGQDKEGGDEADSDADVVGNGPFQALSCDDSHG